MDLEGRAHDSQSSSAGKYTKATSGDSSGMPYWTNSDGTRALWFTKGRWRIGDKSDIGTTTQRLYSTNFPPCPESVGSHWKYWDGEQFLDAEGNAEMVALTKL